MIRYIVILGCFSAGLLPACVHPVKSVTPPVEVTQAEDPLVQRLSQPTSPLSSAVTEPRRSEDVKPSQQPTGPAPSISQPRAPQSTPQQLATETVQQAQTDDHLVMSTCEKIARKLASVSFDDCAELQLSQTGHYSVEGTPILQKVYPPKPGNPLLGRVSLIGGVHGNELSAISIVFKWLEKLQRHHSGLFHWTVVPLLNPDGALRRRATRANANGIDLNRNFPTPNWKQKSQAHWLHHMKRKPGYDPGTAPASEPESQWLIHHIETFRPDVIIAVHSPRNLVDYDAPNRHMAPLQIGMLNQNFLGAYPGSLGNYAGLHKGIPVVTLELPLSRRLPTPSQTSHMWVDLVQWLKRKVPDTVVQHTPLTLSSTGRAVK